MIESGTNGTARFLETVSTEKTVLPQPQPSLRPDGARSKMKLFQFNQVVHQVLASTIVKKKRIRKVENKKAKHNKKASFLASWRHQNGKALRRMSKSYPFLFIAAVR